MHIRAPQGQSGKNLDVSTFFHRKFEKRYASLLYHFGFPGHEDSIKSGGLVPGDFGTSKGRKTVHFFHSSRLWIRKRRMKEEDEKVDATRVSRGQPHGITWNKKLDSLEKSQAQLRLWKKTNAAKSMVNVVIVPNEADTELFFADAERSLADWQPHKRRMLK